MQCSPNPCHLKSVACSWRVFCLLLQVPLADWNWPLFISELGKRWTTVNFLSRNQVVFWMLGPVESLPVPHHTRLLLWLESLWQGRRQQGWSWSFQMPPTRDWWKEVSRLCCWNSRGRRWSHLAGKPFRELKGHFLLCLWSPTRPAPQGSRYPALLTIDLLLYHIPICRCTDTHICNKASDGKFKVLKKSSFWRSVEEVKWH